MANQRPFVGFTDGELRDLSAAMDSAAREGAFANLEIAAALATEASERGIKLELAYGHGNVKPERWLDEVTHG